MSRNRQGLRKLSPDLIAQARDTTEAQVTTIMLTFVGTVIFCVLSLLTPDSALLGGGEKLDVPFAGKVSFFGFILLGPAVLIVLRVYLQIYVEHDRRLDQIARRMPITRAPTLIPLDNQLIRILSGTAFYLLLPLTVLMFAWKASVFASWGSGLLCVAAAVIAGHVTLPLRKLSWRSKLLLSLSAAILVAGVSFGYRSQRRPFYLFRANLSGQWLPDSDLRGANLSRANLSGAYLRNANLIDANLRDADLSGAYLAGANLRSAHLNFANLSGARLSDANLSGAYLFGADLSGARLFGADLSGANLGGANLSGADLDSANLRSARNLTQAQLDKACGKEAKLPEGLILKPCPEAGGRGSR